jgi:hypothetical protein
MADEIGRLIEHQQIVVFVKDFEHTHTCHAAAFAYHRRR